MADDRKLPDDVSIRSLDAQEPDDVEPSQSSASASSTGAVTGDAASAAGTGDVADEIPVPAAMSPAEIDERAQVVEALRGDQSREAESAERANEAVADRSRVSSDDAAPPA